MGGGAGGRGDTKRVKELETKMTSEVDGLKDKLEEFDQGQLQVMEGL